MLDDDDDEQARQLDAAARGLSRWYRHAAPVLAWLDERRTPGEPRLQDACVDVLEAVTTAADALAPFHHPLPPHAELQPVERLDAALRCLTIARTHLRRYISRTPSPVFGEALVRASIDELRAIRVALQGPRDHYR